MLGSTTSSRMVRAARLMPAPRARSAVSAACASPPIVGNVPNEVQVRTEREGQLREFTVTVRIDTPAEAAYYRHGGILQYVLRQLLDRDAPTTRATADWR
jgi:hypothetical protein